MESDGTFFRWLAVDYPFHTLVMEPIKTNLLRVLADIQPQAAKTPVCITVTGGLFSGERMDGQLLVEQRAQPCALCTGHTAIIHGGDSLFLELGTASGLESSIEECLSVAGQQGTVAHSLKRKTDETENILSNLAAAASAWCADD